jgi:hypothetical protein
MKKYFLEKINFVSWLEIIDLSFIMVIFVLNKT